MSENTEQTAEQTVVEQQLEVAERIANQLNTENAVLRAQLAEQPITLEEQRRRHGDELLAVLLGPNTGAASGIERP